MTNETAPPRADADDTLFDPLPDVEPKPRGPDEPKRLRLYDIQAKSRDGTPPALARDVVVQSINDRYAVFAACNEAIRKRSPDVEGLVLLRFVIGADGSVSRVREVEQRVHDESARSCVMDAARNLRFPRPPGSGEVHVQLALYFDE